MGANMKIINFFFVRKKQTLDNILSKDCENMTVRKSLF